MIGRTDKIAIWIARDLNVVALKHKLRVLTTWLWCSVSRLFSAACCHHDPKAMWPQQMNYMKSISLKLRLMKLSVDVLCRKIAICAALNETQTAELKKKHTNLMKKKLPSVTN